MIWDDKHYKIDKVRTYNKAFNFIISGRGPGKSTTLEKMVLDDYFKKGRRAIWLRRNDNMLDTKFYETFLNHFEDYDVVIQNGICYEIMKDEEGKPKRNKSNQFVPDKSKIVIIFGAVSNAIQKFKGIQIDNVESIVYDEFIIDHNMPFQRYLNGEVEALLTVYDTIARNNNYRTKIYFLGNPYSLINPYFTKFKIKAEEVMKNKNKIFLPHPDVLVDYFDVPKEILEERINTPYGRISSLDDIYYGFAFKGNPKYKSMFPIKPFNFFNDKKYLMKVKIKNQLLEFWSIGYGGLYVSCNNNKKDEPIAIDYDSFHSDSRYLTNNNPKAELFDEIKEAIARRTDIVVEASHIEESLRLIVKMK